MNTILPEELKQRLEQGEALSIVDVREPEETAAGMVAGAVNIPLQELPARMAEIPKDQETILICRSGNRSGRAYEYLASQGYTRIVNMTGGMLAWEQL